MIFLSRLAYRLIVCLAGSAVLFAGLAANAPPGSLELPVSDTRLAGPGVDISVIIPTGWHQVPSPQPQTLQMVYPTTCASPKLGCASAFAFIGNLQGFSARSSAELFELAVAHVSGVQGVTVTSAGPTQVAGRTGYSIRFTGSSVTHVTFQVECAAVQSGPAYAGTVRTSLACALVSNRADAPPAGVIDQIVDSAQLSRQPQPAPRTGLVPA